MTSRNGQSSDIGIIKLQFMEEWEAGKRPTLEEYVVLYPELADELTEFVPDFLELKALESQDLDEEPLSPAAERALKRVLAGVFEPAESLREIRRGLAWTHAYLARELNLPRPIVIDLERGVLQGWPAKLEVRLGQTICRAPEQVAMLLRSSRRFPSVAAHFCAKGSPEPSSDRVRTFQEALKECSLSGDLTEAQRQEWLDESST